MAQKAYALYNFNADGGNPIDAPVAGEILVHFRVFARDTTSGARHVLDVDSVFLNGDTDAAAHQKNTTAVKTAVDALGFSIPRGNIRFANWLDGV